MQKIPRLNPFEEIGDFLRLGEKNLRQEFRKIIKANYKIPKGKTIGDKKLKNQLSATISATCRREKTPKKEISKIRKNLNAIFEEIWKEITNKNILNQAHQEETDALSPCEAGEKTLYQMYEEAIADLSPDELKIFQQLPKTT
jgi:hypothetical protein